MGPPRSGLLVIGALAVGLASCATIPTPQEANDAVLTLREYDSWAWALGIALIWADLVLPVPQTAVIAALGIIYGTLLGGLLGSVGLITGGLLGYRLMRTSARRLGAPLRRAAVSAQDGALFDQSGAWAIVLTPQPSLQRPGGHGLPRRTCGHADEKVHRGVDARQRAHRVRLCCHRRRLGRPADPRPRGELCAAHPAAARSRSISCGARTQ